MSNEGIFVGADAKPASIQYAPWEQGGTPEDALPVAEPRQESITAVAGHSMACEWPFEHCTCRHPG